MPHPFRYALVAIAVLVVHMQVVPAAAHPAGSCTPVLESPADGARVDTGFRLTIGVKMTPDNCQVDEIQVTIFDVAAERTAYSFTAECCDVITNRDPVVDKPIPDGKLQPGRTYSIGAWFYDKHLGFSPGTGGALARVETRGGSGDTRQQGVRPQPMVFAVDGTGRFGHGMAETERKARRTALDYCDGPECHVVDRPVRAQCHALAQRTRGGYWWGVGAGSTESDAITKAIHFCERGHDGACDLSYSYCQ